MLAKCASSLTRVGRASAHINQICSTLAAVWSDLAHIHQTSAQIDETSVNIGQSVDPMWRSYGQLRPKSVKQLPTLAMLVEVRPLCCSRCNSPTTFGQLPNNSWTTSEHAGIAGAVRDVWQAPVRQLSGNFSLRHHRPRHPSSRADQAGGCTTTPRCSICVPR